jgi:hypothetical protein
MSDIVVYGARDCPARDSVSLAALKKNEEEQPRPVMTSNRPGFFVTTIGRPRSARMSDRDVGTDATS